MMLKIFSGIFFLDLAPHFAQNKLSQMLPALGQSASYQPIIILLPSWSRPLSPGWKT